MNKKVMITALIGLISVSLGACSSNQDNHEISSAHSSNNSKTKVNSNQNDAKKDSSKSFYAESSSKKTAKSEATEKTADGKYVKFNFPKRMQGVWYGYSGEGAIERIKIKDNQMNSIRDGKNITNTIFDGTVSGRGDDEEFNEERANWMTAHYAEDSELPDNMFENDENGSKPISLYGWFQGAGGSIVYYNTTQKIDGKSVEVLTEATGIGLTDTMHFYRSANLAEEYQDQVFYSDHAE